MEPLVLKWKRCIVEYAAAFGWGCCSFFAVSAACAFGPLSTLIGLGECFLIGALGSLVAPTLYIAVYVRKLESERFVILTKDAITYQKFCSDRFTLRWDDIDEVKCIATTRMSHTSVDLYSRSKAYNVPAFNDIREYQVMLAVIRSKLKKRLGDKASSGQPAHHPKPALVAARWLYSQGDFEEAQMVLRPVLGHAEIFDKKNLHCYLDEYASILKGLGRNDEAREIEARAPEKIKQLLKRRSFLDGPIDD